MAYIYEEATLVSELANPTELRQPALESPVVGGEREEVIRIFANKRAGICADKFNIVLHKPLLNFTERMAMLFRMLILIAEPRLMSGRFMFRAAGAPAAAVTMVMKSCVRASGIGRPSRIIPIGK